MANDDGRTRRSTKATTDAPGEEAATRKAATRKAATRKAATKKAATKKAAEEKAEAAPARKTPARKVPAKKAPAKKAAKKTAAKEAPATKAAAKRPAARKSGAVLAGREKKAPPLRLAAEQTFADDWEEPAPERPREDPAARVRAVLRAAAARIEAREEGPTPAPPAPPAPAPVAPEEPPARVLVAPVTPEPDIADREMEVEEEPEDDVDVADWEIEEEEAEEQDQEDWSPPEVLEADTPAPRTISTAPPPQPPPAPSPAPPSPATPSPETPSPATPSPETPPPEPAPTAATPPPWEPPPPEERKGGGAGLSILAIVLAIFVPLVGAIAGFVLANRGRRRGAALAGVARVVSVLAFVGWLVGGGVYAFDRLRDQGVDYSELQVGDCFDSSATNEVRGVKVKPCSEPHNSEIFFIVTHPAGPEEPYPGKDALVQYAADACLGQPLTEYLGIPLEQSQLKDFEIVPQESAWEDGRRVLVCGVDTGGQGQITGSVRGSGR